MDGKCRLFNDQASSCEPWVELPDKKDFDNWTHEKEIEYNQTLIHTQKLQFFANTLHFIADTRIKGDYHEYGCHRGRTFRMCLAEARRHNLDNMRFFAFDSFEGLPETKSEIHPEWKKGALATSEAAFNQMLVDFGVYVDRCKTIKGFYDQSLSPQLQASFVAEDAKIALCCIDCDLYESAIPIFSFIEPLLHEGSVIYIDDYFCYQGNPERGVAKAFLEFQGRSKFRFIQHLQIGWAGRSFICY